MKNYLIYTLALTFFVLSCSEKKKQKIEEDKMEATRQELSKNYVDTLVLRKTDFNKQINCNGKLRAISKSELSMPSPGIIKIIEVRSGSYVTQGELLAMVDKREVEIELEKAKQQIERTYIDLIDKLIGQGFDEDTTQVPTPILKRAKITSGYTGALEQLATALRKIENCHLYAPFSGRIANMDCKLHQHADKFCTLIDDRYFDVEFNILEAEISMSRIGQRVIVYPFINEQKKFIGEVTEINPVIDEKGQIKIRAKIKNEQGYLVEGMNVRVILENNLPGMYVVPKDAVVLRDGYYVIFKLENGTATWTYVDVLFSNLDSYAITGNKAKKSNLYDNDIIITSGNLNLADGTIVTPRAPKKKRH